MRMLECLSDKGAAEQRPRVLAFLDIQRKCAMSQCWNNSELDGRLLVDMWVSCSLNKLCCASFITLPVCHLCLPPQWECNIQLSCVQREHDSDKMFKHKVCKDHNVLTQKMMGYLNKRAITWMSRPRCYLCSCDNLVVACNVVYMNSNIPTRSYGTLDHTRHCLQNIHWYLKQTRERGGCLFYSK